MSDQLPMDKLAKVYRKIRATMQDLTKKYEAELAVLEEQRATIANAIKDQMLASGSKSVNTEYGTVILSTKTRYYTQDWASFKKFVLAQGVDGLDLFEKRIAQTNMSNFLQANPGVVPPGLNSDSEYVVTVRKPTN